MDTAELNVRIQDLRRLVRATALLLTGAAVHLWLFPFSLAPGHPSFVDKVADGLNSVARRSVVGITGRAPGVLTSALGEVPASANRVGESRAAATNRVRVLIETVHPTLAPALIEATPARLADSLLVPVAPPPGFSLGRSLGGEENVAALPPEFPTLADTPVAPTIVTAAAKLEPPPVPGRSVAPPMTRPAPVVPLAVPRRERPSDEGLVSSVLQQYRAAYESLDVSAAQNVWPTVDARALGAAFRQLAGQRVTFESCGVSVSGSGSQATARCRGQAEYVPKVGGRRAYTASGEWVFDLQRERGVEDHQRQREHQIATCQSEIVKRKTQKARRLKWVSRKVKLGGLALRARSRSPSGRDFSRVPALSLCPRFHKPHQPPEQPVPQER